MAVTYTNPERLAAPAGSYSHLAAGPCGRLVAVAGQVAVDTAGELVGDNDCGRQLVQVLANLTTALEAEGLRPTDILQLTTYLVSSDDITSFSQSREAVFLDLFSDGAYPPNTLLIVDRLVRPEFLVEISAIAVAS